MSALGHVWTAPRQELFDAAAALVRCGHVSGLLMRPAWLVSICSARIGSQSKARTLKCADPNGFSRTAPLDVVRFTQPPFGTLMPQSGRAWMRVGEERFDGDDIRCLYESNSHPRRRRLRKSS